MSTGGAGAYPEHHFRKVIPGNIETVRRRLCDALEEFNYVLLSENPIRAKRAPQKNIWKAMVLEYDIRLTIALKPVNSVSTLATFDYAVQYLFSKGERVALEREADAIIAVANAHLSRAVCPSCETENTGAVRFCRVCGTPVARSKLPAEIEVMQLAANSSGAYVEIIAGLITSLSSLLLALPMIMLASKPKAVIAGWVILALGQLAGLLFSSYGVLRLHRMLSPANQTGQDVQSEIPRAISTQERAALPPHPASVTEGTTELINSSPEPVPLSGKQSRDTGKME